MSTRELLEHREEVLRSVLDSTGLHPRNEALHAFVAQRLDAAAQRGAAARDQSSKRSDAIRGRIRAAWGALPFAGSVTEQVRVAKQRMRARGFQASEKTIRSELQAMREEVGEIDTGTTKTRG